MRLDNSGSKLVLAYVGDHSSLFDQIYAKKYEDDILAAHKDQVLQTGSGQATVDLNFVHQFDDWLCITIFSSIIQLILHENHDFRYSTHPSMMKIY